MMNRWLDRGVDGFRMDVICLLSKVLVDGELPDGRLERDPLGAGVVDVTKYGDTTPLVVNGPRIHEFMQEMHREVFAGRPPGLLNVGETPATTIEQARLYTDPARGEVDMVFQFEHVDLDSGPRGKWDIVPMTMLDLKRSWGRWQDGLAEAGWNSLYLGNHDQPRCVTRYGNDAPEHREQSAKSLATVLHLHRGTPYVYQGDELGLPNVGLHPDRPDARHRVAQPLRHGGRGRAGPGGRDGRPVGQGPRQRPGADALGRLAARVGSRPGRPGSTCTP